MIHSTRIENDGSPDQMDTAMTDPVERALDAWISEGRSGASGYEQMRAALQAVGAIRQTSATTATVTHPIAAGSTITIVDGFVMIDPPPPPVERPG